MATELKRMTFVVTPEIESLLDGIKQDKFYNCSQSEMIRTLVEAGLKAFRTEKDGGKKQHERTA